MSLGAYDAPCNDPACEACVKDAPPLERTRVHRPGRKFTTYRQIDGSGHPA